MIHTIQVDRVLRDAAPAPYRNLITRPTGAAVRSVIQHHLSQLPPAPTWLDFSQVGLMDFSCADEVVAKLLLGTEPAGERYILLRGLDDDHSQTISEVLGHQSLAVAVLDQYGRPTLLGKTNPDLRIVFGRAHALGPGWAEDLAADLGWSVERAADALLMLALLRVIAAEGGFYRPLPLA